MTPTSPDHVTPVGNQDLAGEIARIANISLNLGYRIEKENRLSSKEEAYSQLGHSTSLLKAILEYVEKIK